MFECNLALKECSDNLQERWEQVRVLGETICTALSSEVKKIGLEHKALVTAPWERARFELQRDPANGQSSLVGTWQDANGQRVGSIIFHCDGTFFAEYDVVEQHPSDRGWFVEAVNAWGNQDTIKVEPRLLSALA
ncbi:hypothetical protein [Kaarinaea lacus]